MAHESYDIGDAPAVTVNFVDVDDVATDPTTVTFKVQDPAGTTTTTVSPDASITNPSVGEWVYQMDTLTTHGQWHVRAEGTGALTAAEEIWFIVDVSVFS